MLNLLVGYTLSILPITKSKEKRHSMELTYSTKKQVISHGGNLYWDAEFPAPPVGTSQWEPGDWVTWVDHNGTWFVKKGD